MSNPAIRLMFFGMHGNWSPAAAIEKTRYKTHWPAVTMGTTATWQSKVAGILISDYQIKVLYVNFHQEFSL